MRTGHFLSFAGKVTAAHIITYFIAGAIAYPLLTQEFYVGPNPIFKVFIRTEAEPELWGHVVTWFLPAQFLRGFLMAAALYPFFNTLMDCHSRSASFPFPGCTLCWDSGRQRWPRPEQLKAWYTCDPSSLRSCT